MMAAGRTIGLLLRFDLSIRADDESILNRSSILYSVDKCRVTNSLRLCTYVFESRTRDDRSI